MLRTNHGELLDLFFARLLPSGTGDFDAGPSQLREKQTNPIMIDTLSFDGVFFLIKMETVCTRIAISMIVLPTTFAFISTRRCTRMAS